MTQQLSLYQKIRYMEMLIDRDGGFKCYYCKKELVQNKAIFEHLNGRRTDNRLDNLVLACQSCNVKKSKDYDLTTMAEIKLDQNEKEIFVGEKYRKKIKSGGYKTTKEASKEIDINTTNSEVTEQYIIEVVNAEGSFEYKEALNSCVYLCKRKTGHGSQQSVRNYIASLTSRIAPFEIKRDENGQKVIVKRTNESQVPITASL